MNYEEKLKEFARYVRAYYIDELEEWAEWNNHNKPEDKREYIIKPEHKDKIEEVYQDGDNGELESEEYDQYYNMELIEGIIEDYDHEPDGARDELIWDSAYLSGMRDAQRPIYIEITEQELQELQEGEVFNWEFNGIKVQVSTEQDLPF
jgi:hypothetical protein